MKFARNNWLAIALLSGLAACQSNSPVETGSDLETAGLEKAMEQEFKMTRDPYLNIIPRERLEVARARMAALTGSGTFRTNALTWTERGPSNIGGRTRAILVDRRDATGNTVFAGSVSGGIFKTTNFLSATPNWTPVNDKLNNLAISALLQDRTNGAIMYAGTGEGYFNIDAVKGAGIYKSTDGGATWTLIPSSSSFEFVQDLVQDNNGNLYASLRNANTTFRGVQRSTDGGTTWTQVLGAGTTGSSLNFATGRAADLEVASNGDLYATLGIFSRTAVYRSSASLNGANTGAANAWVEITPVKSFVTQRADISVAPSDPNRLYLVMQDSANSQVRAVYRSSNAGTTWDSLAAPSSLNNGGVSQTWFNLCSAVDPNNPDIVVVGGLRVARSTDGGSNWTEIGSNIHVDQHVLLYNSSSSLIVGNDGGVYHSPDVNSPGQTWLNKNNGYNVTQFYGADLHPTDVNYFLAGAQDNNTQKFTSAGLNATAPVVGGDGGFPHIDQTDGQIQIASTTGNNFYRSLNGGTSWSYMSGVSNSRGQFINPTDYDDNLNTLYAGDDPGKYYVVNNLGATPASVVNTVPQIGSSREATAFKADPFVQGQVWIGTNSLANGIFPVVLKVSTANTISPTVLTVGTLPGVPAGATVSGIDVDPSNSNRAVAVLSNFGVTSVFETTDGGTSWTAIEGNLPDMPVYSVVILPANAQFNGASGGNGGIMIGTELGVWATTASNGAATVWLPNSNNNLPNVKVHMLKFRQSDFTVLAATHGRGLWTTLIPSTTTGVPTVENTKNFIRQSFVSGSQLVIRAGNTATTRVQVRIFNMKGQQVYSSEARYGDLTLPVHQLPASSYVLKIFGNKGEQYTYQFVR